MPIPDHCPDCIPLPVRPPYGCFPIVLEAIKGNVPDPKEAVHCAYTIIGWGLSFYIGSDPVTRQVMDSCPCDPECDLATLISRGEGMTGKDAEAINWKGLLEKLAQLIPLLISLF